MCYLWEKGMLGWRSRSGSLLNSASQEGCLGDTWRWKSLLASSAESGTRKLWTLALETEDLQTQKACAFQGEAASVLALPV